MTNKEFEKIYGVYFTDVYYYALSLSKDKSISEDLTSETFLKAIKSIDSFRGETSLRVWLCQIAKNEYFSRLRKDKRLDFRDNLETVTSIEISNSLEKDFISEDQALKINRMILLLDEPYGEIFKLRFYGEMSFKQIGDLFGKTDNWACVTYHRARKKLQRELEEKL
nr:sigma-70 family RNA polymerase sigma factor [Tissierella sp.]